MFHVTWQCCWMAPYTCKYTWRPQCLLSLLLIPANASIFCIDTSCQEPQLQQCILHFFVIKIEHHPKKSHYSIPLKILQCLALFVWFMILIYDGFMGFITHNLEDISQTLGTLCDCLRTNEVILKHWEKVGWHQPSRNKPKCDWCSWSLGWTAWRSKVFMCWSPHTCFCHWQLTCL